MNTMPSRPPKRVLALAVAAILLPSSLAAQEGGEFPMPVIEVIGKSDDAVSRQTGSVVLIDREALELIQPLSTDDALRRVAGINTATEDETAIVANLGIRGLSASESKSLILEDGVPVAPGLFIGNERYFNPRIQRVERIEVLKGSASLRYGPSTIGGVVNYQTKTPDDGVLLSGRLGSFDTREASLEAGGRSASGDAFAGLVATRAESDGFMDKDYEMTDILVKSGMALSDSQEVGVKFSWYENDANISYRGLLLGDYEAGATYNPAPDDYFLTDRVAFDLNHAWRINDNARLQTVAYWSEVSRDYWRYNVDDEASNEAGRWVYTDTLTGNNRSFERLGLETRLQLDHQLFGLENAAEIGFRVMSEESDDTRIRATRDADRTGINDRHRVDSADSIAAHVQNRMELTDRLAVTPGLRIESYEQKRRVLTENNASAKTSNTELLPGIGATFELTPTAQLYGGLYRAFSPAANGVALDGLTDQNLDGERSNNYEVGIRGLRGKLSYEVAAFYMDFDNQVVTGNSDPNLSQSNAGETLHKGMELILGYELGAGFSVDANATWVPESDFQTGEFEGNRLPYAPEHLANLALSYHEGQWNAALTAHYRGSQFGDASNQVAIPDDAAGGIWGGKMPSYTLLDFLAEYEFSSSLTVFGAVKNLTDERYITGLRQGIYVGPERSFEIGARFRL
ncbi:TonB-dependent receptor [Haliea sp.]|uniref:TonB-dependent receptor family protein n=1 Tax=Haliea sp. TaxID=1932666 RepID=UPI0025BD7FDB|nr:TonB-dependent receptor [Haliea sp.]|tara:strand:- start:11956 stop:14013 length:2058 start_codon:yes stop_codon:yes gene_type:complete